MIGPGTGLAPFRGFLQERANRKNKGNRLGPAMLFFGCRHPDQDYLYADELKAFAADGVTELYTAFSRGEGPKTYVQHLIAAQKEKVWNLIGQGAITYVCGDGGKMEPDVKAALVAIYRERSGSDAAAGQSPGRKILRDSGGIHEFRRWDVFAQLHVASAAALLAISCRWTPDCETRHASAQRVGDEGEES